MAADTVQSLSELMHEAFIMSLNLTHSTLSPDGDYFDARGIDGEHGDMVYGWADGLMHKYYENRATGHCSLQAMIDFDVGKFEASVVEDIEIMKELAKTLPPPRKLTYAEMRARGYTGSWAGLNEQGEIIHA